MIDRQHGDIVFECDSCGIETLETKTSDFGAAWKMAKREGWRTRKIGTLWVHSCPQCE